MELSHASFLLRPSDSVKSGPVLIEWMQDGAFLAMRMGDKSPGPPQALWLIGRDDSAPNYTMLYYDARSVSRVYEMSFSQGVWKMWKEELIWFNLLARRCRSTNTLTKHAPPVGSAIL
jgi:hypothetical protein